MLKTLLKIAISFSILGLIVWKLGGLNEVGSLMLRINLGIAALIVAVNMLDRALMTYKWSRLLRSRGVNLPFFRGMRIYCAAMIWGMFLPATVGADAVRAYSTARTGLEANEVVASIVIERMIGFLSALLLGFSTLVLLSIFGTTDTQFAPLLWAAIVAIAVGILIFGASFSDGAFHVVHNRLLGRFEGNKIAAQFRKFHETYKAYQNDRKSLGSFFGLTSLEQLFPIAIAWLTALALGVEVGLVFVAAAVSLSMLVARLPIGIDGIGTFEAAFIAMLALAGVSAAEAIAIAFSSRILQTISWLPWWLGHVLPIGTYRPPVLARE